MLSYKKDGKQSSTTTMVSALGKIEIAQPKIKSKEEILEEAIKIARKKFVSGDIFKALRVKDPHFPNYDANRIKGTHLIAAKGPEISEMQDFIESTLFSKYPIRHIIALGHALTVTEREKGIHDFYDYCGFSNKTVTWGAYTAHIIRDEGVMKVNAQTRYPLGIVEAKIFVSKLKADKSIDKRVLNVTLYQIKDMKSLCLKNDAGSHENLFFAICRRAKTSIVGFIPAIIR